MKNAMKNEKPTTLISTFDEKGSTIRGKDLVNDLIGEVSFTHMIYFYILGRAPTPAQTKILDAVLVTLVDHGIVGAASARMVYRGAPDSIQGAVATGLLGMGSQFGGVMEQVGKHLDEIIAAADPEATAREIVAKYRLAKKPLPGFGHNDYRPEDPRTPKLLKVAEEAGVPGKHIAALRMLSAAVDSALGKHITINATAGMAALLGEIGVPGAIMRGFALISRTPGIVGHLYEEQQRPAAGYIARLAQESVEYAGKTQE
jgi:citrate synthase